MGNHSLIFRQFSEILGLKSVDCNFFQDGCPFSKVSKIQVGNKIRVGRGKESENVLSAC